MVEAVALNADQHIRHIRKEWHTRRHAGRHVAYLLVDRSGLAPIVVAQKLPLLRWYINERVAEAAWERVSVNGMLAALDKTENRVGGWMKGRWRIVSVDLEGACDFLRSLRQEHGVVVVSSELNCYELA